jgi:hypothetical protein
MPPNATGYDVMSAAPGFESGLGRFDCSRITSRPQLMSTEGSTHTTPEIDGATSFRAKDEGGGRSGGSLTRSLIEQMAADLEAVGVGQFARELLLLIVDGQAAVDQIRRAGDVVAVW